MKTYEAIFKPGKTAGVYGISLVEKPAMEGHFITLSEEEKALALKTINEEERILIGLVLEPNKPIYRKQDGEEFNVIFSEETIKELSYEFYRGGFHKNSSVEHNDRIEGVTFVESWLIEDSKNDKSNALGLSYPKGSWMATMKVDSDEVWQDYVKTGKVKGFSVDALVSLEEIKLKQDIKMSDNKDTNSIVEAIKQGFEEFKAFFKKDEVTVELGTASTEDKQVEINFEGDALEVGGRVWVVAEDGTEVPLPVGEYPLEDKRVLVVTEEGKVGELKEAPAAEEPTPEAQPQEMSNETKDAIAQAVKSVLIKYSEEETARQDERFAKLEEAFNAKIVELSEQPASKPIKAVPAAPAAAPTSKKGKFFQELQNS